jgi:hypothetical protein
MAQPLSVHTDGDPALLALGVLQIMDGETKAAFIVGGLITALRLFWYGGSWLSYWRRTRAVKRLNWMDQ